MKMTEPNFFGTSGVTEKVFLTADKKYWVEVKTELTMDDMIRAQEQASLSPEEHKSVFRNTQLLLLACIVNWNLPNPEAEGQIQPVTFQNIQKLNLKAFAALAPIMKRIQEESFLSEGSTTPSENQS